jgi:integrase
MARDPHRCTLRQAVAPVGDVDPSSDAPSAGISPLLPAMESNSLREPYPAAAQPDGSSERVLERPNTGTAARAYPSEIFTPEEVLALIGGCRKDRWGLRLRAYIAVLYRTGMEANEGLSLCYEHLDLSPGAEKVQIPASRLKPRVLTLDDMAASILQRWLAVRRPLPGEHVFCTLHGKTLGGPWAASELRRELRKLGNDVLGKRVNAGAFRNTLTAELIIEQWPLPYIQTQLGLQGIWSFRDIFPKLGIESAPQNEVAEIARARPSWGPPSGERP